MGTRYVTQALPCLLGWLGSCCGGTKARVSELNGNVRGIDTFRDQNEMVAILQTFSNAFPWVKSLIFWFRFCLSLFRDSTWEYNNISSDFNSVLVRWLLTHLPLVPHMCLNDLGQHWFRYWLVTYLAPSHYLNQCWDIVNRFWWLCLVPTLTTRFASDLGYRITKNSIGLYK